MGDPAETTTLVRLGGPHPIASGIYCPNDMAIGERFDFTAREGPLSGRTHPVHAFGDAADPPVLVMHELFGLSPGNIAFAEHLAAAEPGYRVYVPVLFGTPGRSSYLGLLGSKICLRREFVIFRSGRSSPIVTWMRELIADVSRRHGGRDLGVIGMCFSGGFVLGMIADESVAIGIASQPSLPFPVLRSLVPSVQRDLGLGPEDLDAARTGSVPLTLLRYGDDWMCPRQRGEKAATMFGGVGSPVPDRDGVSVAEGDRMTLV